MYKLKLRKLNKPILIVILIFIQIFYPFTTSIIYLHGTEEKETDLQEFNFNQFQPKQNKNYEWEGSIAKVDKNKNGINDNFETRLEKLSEFGFIEENLDDYNFPEKISIDFPTKKERIITSDDIPVIISFPEDDDGSIASFFEDLGGRIKNKYSAAINGFTGRIDYTALNIFCDTLRENNIPFFIEEDRIYQAQLYYAGRNMNLRPYVWNTLSFDGDEYSSIAIIDTGVDDSHNFMSPGYSDGDSSYKIVGWRDEINSLASPYDDNGHGSHCGGIATGEGSPSYDENGRSVATAAYYFDYTGIDIGEGEYLFDWTRFNVTDPGLIELLCKFDDFTPGLDDVDFWAYLYYENILVDSYIGNFDSWSHNLSYIATSSSLGMYSFRFVLDLIDNTGDGYVSDFDIRFSSEIHWPFDPPQYGSGDPWKGVAPDANLVGIKVLDEHGSGWGSDIINGINWAITNKMMYNITTISLSLGGPAGDTGLINAVNNAVNEGIVTVVSAGNSGPGYNYIGSPGDADNVITVAAMNTDDEITDYSSQGGSSYTGSTTKPDITAPGGSFNNLQIFSADSNDNDAEGVYPSDGYLNDLFGAQGTSMSAPAVAGASNLLIDAMGGHGSWGYTAEEAKRVKALLLMSATETYPLTREIYGTIYSPLLNRGGKDVHEGYGRLNVDTAIEAYTQGLTLGSDTTSYLTASSINSFTKHALGCYVNLIEGESYIFTLDVPVGADFDLHLYSNNSTSIGEPIMIAKSTSNNLGEDEVIAYTAKETGKYYLIAKAISGEGDAVISYPILDHDLHVSIEVPDNPEPYGAYIINATVLNNGLNTESDIELYLYLDSTLVDSTSISTLNIDQELTINYPWTPLHYKSYNFTAYAPILLGEPIVANNYLEQLVKVDPNLNYTLTEGVTYTWIDASGGTELFLSDDGYATISLPFDFQFYNATFSTIYLAANGYLSFVDSSPSYYLNVPIPSVDPDHQYLIAPFWDDIYLPYGGHIYVQSFGTYWVAEWLNVYHFSDPLIGSFEVILYESGEIVFNYDYLDYTTGSYTCGLNFGADTRYYNTYQNLNPSTDNFALLFNPWWVNLDHDLDVSLELPTFVEPNNSYMVNASVTNRGKYDESNIDLFFYLDESLLESQFISSLLIGETETINYLWTPTEYDSYNFMAYTPYLPTEPYIDNNIKEVFLPVKEIKIFDDMYLNYSFTIFDEILSIQYSYTYLSDGIFHNNYSLYSEGSLMQGGSWDVNSQTRMMFNSYGGISFGSGYHTPLWIFTDISIGDEIPIAVDAEGDHVFNVSRELSYKFPGVGTLNLWELQDLSFPDAVVWYERTTGILINGTFIYYGGLSFYIFGFGGTNAISVSKAGDKVIPGYNLYILIGILCIVSTLIVKRKKKEEFK